MIYYIIGIRRSGLHAIAQWLFPMMGEYIYLNNVEPGKLTDIEMIVNGNFNVIIGLENRTVDEIELYATKGKKIWVHRELDDVIKSQRFWYTQMEMEQHIISAKISESKKLWLEYNNLVESDLDMWINYDEWNENKEYRGLIARDLKLQFNDSNKDKIYPVYGISSYDLPDQG